MDSVSSEDIKISASETASMFNDITNAQDILRESLYQQFMENGDLNSRQSSPSSEVLDVNKNFIIENQSLYNSPLLETFIQQEVSQNYNCNGKHNPSNSFFFSGSEKWGSTFGLSLEDLKCKSIAPSELSLDSKNRDEYSLSYTSCFLNQFKGETNSFKLGDSFSTPKISMDNGNNNIFPKYDNSSSMPTLLNDASFLDSLDKKHDQSKQLQHSDVMSLLLWIEGYVVQYANPLSGGLCLFTLSKNLEIYHQVLYQKMESSYGSIGQFLQQHNNRFLILNDQVRRNPNWLRQQRSFFMDQNAVGNQFKSDIRSHHTYLKYQSFELYGGMKEEKIIETLDKVRLHSWHILAMKENTMPLKSVELANEVRQRVSTEGLQIVKVKFQGFLTFLEQYPDIFRVYRIPKEDAVALVAGASTDQRLKRSFEKLCQQSANSPGSIAIPKSNKCLHIGNVPQYFTEEDFKKEFQRFYPVATSLICHKGRSYGFLRFVSIEEATKAKDELSKSHIWGEQVSFAKRDVDEIQANSHRLSQKILYPYPFQPSYSMDKKESTSNGVGSHAYLYPPNKQI